ncbi:START-like domain-containing protein [Flammeovirga sp. EKP202]|uniref:START-like domain-containing protein n=1 Tax=Flammeovirga sp. EKP202 TaxID=2770592 RepID=UPI00165F5282|nr:START-like domain-containing protein [Flammeovirga sp. EKP202]MBD0400813.1 ATPase [Flammeovirga sp. EKP202]
MARFKYISEFEFKAPLHKLYPYFVTPNLLKDWFADKVTENSEQKIMSFVWGNEEKRGRIAVRRQNQHVKYVFEKEEDQKSAYLDFKFDFSELAQSTFVIVTDYSDMDDMDELKELWEEFFGRLHEIVGG